MEEKIQRIRVLTQKEMQQFLPTSGRDRANYNRHKNDSELLTKLDFEAGLCTLNNQIEDEPSSIVFFPGATLPGIEKINNKEPNYAEEVDDENSETTLRTTRKKRQIIRGKSKTKNRKKTVFEYNKKKDFTEEELKYFYDYKMKFYSSPEHACTSMLKAVIFPADMYHASVPPKKGARLSLQLQIERVTNRVYPNMYPRMVSAAILMDDDDELYKFLKANVEKMLGVIMAEKDKKDSFSVKQGEAISWMDLIDPTKPKTNKKDVNNAITKLLEAAKKSLKRMKNEKQNKMDASGGSLASLLLEHFSVNDHLFMDARIVHASQSCAFDIHNDIGQNKASNKSVTIHMNLFTTSDYEPGDTNSGPWTFKDLGPEKFSTLYNTDLSIRGLNGIIDGYLGERKIWFCKGQMKFIDGIEKRNRMKAKHATDWKKAPPPDVARKIINRNFSDKNIHGSATKEFQKRLGPFMMGKGKKPKKADDEQDIKLSQTTKELL